MKFFAALKQAEFAQKLFAAAGLKFEDMFAKGDENALKAHLESLKPAGDITALNAKVTALTEENTTLTTALTAAKAEFDAAVAERDGAKADCLKAVTAGATLTGALAAAGVKLPEATAEKPLDQAAVQKAIDARTSAKAREQLAASGHNLPLPAEPDADPAKASAKPAIDPKLTGIERTIAAFKAKSSGKN